ncbi:TPA: type II toxin-antitoxin system HicB family antitoxin [bacterium]|nr:type II toxin-antitoxin system HicB family antitoxin [bacterium]
MNITFEQLIEAIKQLTPEELRKIELEIKKSDANPKEHIFEVVIEPDEDRYHAYCPSLKGCRTWGQTEEEAYKNIKEALELYLEALIDEGDPIQGIGIVKNIKDIKPIIKMKKEALV